MHSSNITFFFPTRFHMFEQLLHADLRMVAIYSVYPNVHLRRGRFDKLAAVNHTLWLGLLVYALWRVTVRLRAPRGIQIMARRLYFQAAAAEFSLRLRDRAQTIVCSAGYLGNKTKSLQERGHRVISNHGSLYERYVADYLRNVAGLTGANDLSNWVNDWLLARMDQEFGAANLIIVCSNAAQSCLPKPWRSKSRVVPLGAPDWSKIKLDGRQVAGEQGMTFLHVSSLVQQKNVDRILDAFALSRKPRDRLLIGGPCPRDPKLLRRMAREVGVNYLGRLSRAGLKMALAESDVFVHPSLADGWAMTVTEALGAGLSVVSSPMTGAADYYHTLWQKKDPTVGPIHLVDPLSHVAIAEGMRAARVTAGRRNQESFAVLIGWPHSSKILFQVVRENGDKDV